MEISNAVSHLDAADGSRLMWPTIDGHHKFEGVEGALIRGATGVMLDQLVVEGRETATGEWSADDSDEAHTYSIEWFDLWDWRQRIWLLDEVASALLTDHDVIHSAAIFDGTVDAILREAYDLVVLEISQTDAGSATHQWRQTVLDAVDSRNLNTIGLTVEKADPVTWLRLIMRYADTVFGPRCYLQAEEFRDGDFAKTKAFLDSKGLPSDYLDRIPTLRTESQTQASIERIQSLLAPN